MSAPPVPDALWRRIEAFRFDAPGIHLRFAARLAREQRWTGVQARRVLREYRRYLYLATT